MDTPLSAGVFEVFIRCATPGDIIDQKTDFARGHRRKTVRKNAALAIETVHGSPVGLSIIAEGIYWLLHVIHRNPLPILIHLQFVIQNRAIPLPGNP